MCSDEGGSIKREHLPTSMRANKTSATPYESVRERTTAVMKTSSVQTCKAEREEGVGVCLGQPNGGTGE